MATANVRIIAIEITCSDCGQHQTGPVSGMHVWYPEDAYDVHDRKSETPCWNDWECDGCGATLSIDGGEIGKMEAWYHRNRL
jgi:ribosomal protein S27E